MSYTITDYSNKKIGNGLTVDDYTTNTSTILDLIGKGNIDYSVSMFENLIYLQSNFSNPYPPGSNFATNYQNNNGWLPTLSATASSTMTMDKTVLPGTFWFQTPELNICSNTIATLVKGYNESKDTTIGTTLLSTYDPNNYFVTNQNSVYGQDIDSSGTLWIYVGSTNTSISPNITTYNSNFIASYDPSDLGWEAYSTITVSTKEPANRYAIWLNMNDNNFYFYDSSKAMWARIGTPSNIEPTEDSTSIKIADGTFWIKDGQLWMKDNVLDSNNSSYPPLYQNTVDTTTVSNGWILVGPESPTPDKQVNGSTTGFNGTGSRYAVLIDTANAYHDNTLLFSGGTLIAIVSKDKFTVNATTPILGGDTLTPSITGFEVYPGINLVSPSFYFNGSITDGGVDYATKQYVDEAVTGGDIGYTPVQQGGGTGMNTAHIFMGQSTDGNDIYVQAGSQQYGAIAFESWTNTNFLSLANGGVVKGATSFNGGATTVTTSINDNSTNIATTAFVNNLLKASYLNKVDGDTATGKIAFNGGATSVTPASGDNSTNIATTAFIQNALGYYVPTNPVSGQVACTNLVYSTSSSGPYFTSSAWSGRLLTSSDSLGYLPTSDTSGGKLINSRLDNTYNLPSFQDKNSQWHTVPDMSYLSNALGNFIKKTGDNVIGLISFENGLTTKTMPTTDSSTYAASTAFVKNAINNKISSNPGTTSDRSITNLIQGYGWETNGSAGLGCYNSDGTLIKIADNDFVQTSIVNGLGLDTSKQSPKAYATLPGGLIIQSGNGSSGDGGNGYINFPKQFPTACVGVIISEGAGGNTWPGSNGAGSPTVHSVSYAPSVSGCGTYSMRWFANGSTGEWTGVNGLGYFWIAFGF